MAAIVVKITETLVRTLTIQADYSLDEAISSVRDEYRRANIILDSSDFRDVIFTAEFIKETDDICTK